MSARTISAITAGLKAALISAASSVGLVVVPDNWSLTDYKKLILDTIASGMGIQEQLWDSYAADTEILVSLSAPETGLWWQNQMLAVFQFDSANPQVVQILPPSFSPKYALNNDTLKIIKYCAVVQTTFGRVLIKVAAQVSGQPADIDTTYGAGTLDTVKSFANTISDITIVKVVQSGLPDKIMIGATIYYNGLYAAVIQNKVIASINTYFSVRSQSNPTGIPFNGFFDLTDLARVIKSVDGVNSFILNNINARADVTAFIPGTYNMIQSNTELIRNFQLISGYCITENTVGYLITDTLTFIPE